MLKRVSALALAMALGVVMAGCQPAEEGGGGGFEQREPGETMASPSPDGGMMNDDGIQRDSDDRAVPGNTP